MAKKKKIILIILILIYNIIFSLIFLFKDFKNNFLNIKNFINRKIFFSEEKNNINIETNNFVNTNNNFIEIDNDYIYVDTKNFKLYYLNKCYDVGLGKPSSPTPTGVGIIYEKREKIVFKYSKGPLKGNIITHYVGTNGEMLPMPYTKMRALGIIINKEKKYSIHSTTELNSIREYKSAGCIRMKIEDMLELFEKVNVGTIIIIK